MQGIILDITNITVFHLNIIDIHENIIEILQTPDCVIK